MTICKNCHIEYDYFFENYENMTICNMTIISENLKYDYLQYDYFLRKFE